MCPTGSVLSLGYTYPPAQNNGNVSSISVSGAGLSSPITQTFVYDGGMPATGFNRLTSFTETGSTANQTYGYDNLGNRWVSYGANPTYTAQTPTSNNFANNQWAPGPGSGVTYDLAGNQTSIYLGTAGTRSFTYDAENRQITASIPGMSAISYVYDGDGRRVQKTVGTTVTTYIYDAQGELAEELGGPTNPYAGRTTYLTSDHLGSTRAVTSDTGSPLARYDYAPFGDGPERGHGRPHYAVPEQFLPSIYVRWHGPEVYLQRKRCRNRAGLFRGKILQFSTGEIHQP